MRVLFSTGRAARQTPPPRLSDDQINCGPDWRDEHAPDGRVVSLATPAGEYNLAAIAAKLSPHQQPDVVVCLVDSAWRNLPRNLAAFKCPRVLLVASTHHARAPLTGLMRYLAAEKFDRVVFLSDRHHVALFHAAGFRNLHWFPGLTFPHTDAAVLAARKALREARIAFVGSTGPQHASRARLLGGLAARGLPLAAHAMSPRDALGFYGGSLIGFNASLNGDLNLRVFEILASGAALLTDRLAPEAGIERLVTDGIELATYGDAAELARLCEDYLAHPAAVLARGREGARWFDQVLGESPRRAAFRSLAFDGVDLPEFEIRPSETSRVFFADDPERLRQSLAVYEGIQELHRTRETVRVLLDKKTAPDDFTVICTTLPRVKLTRTLAEGDVDLAIFGRAAAENISGDRTARLWCWNAEDADRTALAAKFGALGFEAVDGDLAMFCRPESAAQAALVADADQARVLFERGDLNAAYAIARAALERDPCSPAARIVLGEIALQRDGAPLAEKLFRQALVLHASDALAEPLLADALRVQEKFREAGEVLALALQARRHDLAALLALARLRLAEAQSAAAEAALREAARHHRNAPTAALALGDFLKRAGRTVEALAWHRRALGCGDEVGPLDAATRRVRVAFIVQNAAGWSAVESVWRAMCDDLAFEAAVIAAPDFHAHPAAGGADGIDALLEEEGVPFVKWDALPLGPGFSDVVFLHNAIDATRPEPLRAANLLRLVPRLAYVAEDLELGGGAERVAAAFDQPLQQFAWLVGARSGRERASYEKRCAVGSAHVVVTGHPKLDALRKNGALHTAELAHFAAGRKLIAWNPHYDVRPRRGSAFGGGASTFLRWWKFLLAEFARRPGLALVIRPHPRFFAALESRGAWKPAQREEFLAAIAQAENVRLVGGDSPRSVIAGADALLTDLSSLLLEFVATGKPLLYLHNPQGPPLGDDGEFVGAHCDTAVVEADIADFLDRVTAGADPLAAQRAAACAEYLHRPVHGAGWAIKQEVIARLAAEAPLLAAEKTGDESAAKHGVAAA